MIRGECILLKKYVFIFLDAESIDGVGGDAARGNDLLLVKVSRTAILISMLLQHFDRLRN